MGLTELGLGEIVPWTMRLRHGYHETVRPASEMPPIAYPKYDGTVTFDRMSSVFLSNTHHEVDQPVHLH
jgi:electron-transferring-flavoprotein dehydrogenase